MAEKHNQIEAQYRVKLIRKKFKIERRSPFVDYRPDIAASKGKVWIFVEVEIESTLHSDHTLHQIDTMYRLLEKNKRYLGVLVIPNSVKSEAKLLIESVFGDERIRVDCI